MDIRSNIARAKRGLREEKRLYFVAVSSLAVAFLCLGTVIVGLSNLDHLAERWGQSGRITVYLKEGADPQDVAQLRLSLQAMGDVDSVEHVSSEQARALFIEQTDVGTELENLPAEAFPASIEVSLKRGAGEGRAEAIAASAGEFRAVSETETYQTWFQRLDKLLQAGSWLAIGLALLVGFCVLAVIGNTIRLAVARRRQEIEVMKLCGATNSFVSGPFVLEGIFQGFVSAFLALLFMGGVYFGMRGYLNDTIAVITGTQMVFLAPWAIATLLVGGAAIGALGGALSVRRYMAV